MRRGFGAALAAAGLLAIGSGWAADGEAAKGKAAGPKKVALVELFTSQGCDSCPPASELVGKLPSLGYGPGRVVALNFHVDYFNDPWRDPFSDPSYSRREWAYGQALHRDDLYFTPMLMADGRIPMLGSDRKRLVAALDEVLAEAPAATLALSLADSPGRPRRKTLTLEAAPAGPTLAGRELLAVIAIYEGPLTTRVPAGENAGKALVEHNVVRSFKVERLTLDPAGSRPLTLPITLPRGLDPARSGVAAFLQDETSARVFQAASVPWQGARR